MSTSATAATHRTAYTRRLSVWALTLALIGAICAQLSGDMLSEATSFGTLKAPYSDALGPWLHGGLNYLFYGEPHGYLYRPTIGMFFGAILAATGRVEAIAVFFAAATFAFLLIAVPKSDQSLRAAMLAWLFMAGLSYPAVLQPLNFPNSMPDVPAFLFTVAGLYFVLMAIREVPTNAIGLALGLLCLGIAAAIRGPMMLAAPGIVALVYAMTKDERRLHLVWASIALFLTPIVLDALIQKTYGIANNGIEAMFCFSTEPSRFWTPSCQQHYQGVKPSSGLVITQYLQTLLSVEGFSSVVGNLGTRLQTEGAVLRSTSFWGPFLLVVLWQSWMVVRNASALNETVTHHRSFIAVLRDHRLALIRIAFIALTAVTAAMWGSAQALVIAMSLAVAAASLVGRLHRPIIALIAYWGGAIFLALVMQAQQDRLALTFSFALYIAIFLSMCDQPRSDARSLRLRTSYGLGAGVALIVVMLYGGVFVFSSEWKSIYHSRVVGRNAALKLSEDRILDRCLHYTGARELIYTRCNDSPVGTVREYAQIEAPLGMWNASYRAPASFLP